MKYTWKLSSLVLKRRREGSNYFGNLKETALSGGNTKLRMQHLFPRGVIQKTVSCAHARPAESESPGAENLDFTGLGAIATAIFQMRKTGPRGKVIPDSPNVTPGAS